MLSHLRNRLILSHVLPLIVIVPIMGLVLIYVLEVHVLLPDITSELIDNAALAAELARERPEIWTDQVAAATFATYLQQFLSARVMLLDGDGRTLAVGDQSDVVLIGEQLAPDLLAEPLSGTMSARAVYSRRLHAEIADVLMPVVDKGGQVLGIIRLNHRLAGVQEQFLRLRYLIAGVLMLGLLPGIALGLLLALTLERPLNQVTQLVQRLAEGRQLVLPPEQGPTEVRILLRAANTLVERLHSLESARRQLLANLVHELGRPLGALRSAIQALLDGATQDEAFRDELLAGMMGEVERLHRLLVDLAHLHDQVLGTLELERQPTELADWLPGLLVTWRQRAQEKGVRWQVDISPALPSLDIDPNRLAQAIGNLLSNAIKYTPVGGTVVVEAGLAEEGVWIGVTDSGPGISMEDQAAIFTPFYRGSQGGRFPQGMGLGLSIAHDLVTAHGGRLLVDSSPGQGSHFTIWLPLAASPQR